MASFFAVGNLAPVLNVNHSQRFVFASLDSTGQLINNAPPQPNNNLYLDNIFTLTSTSSLSTTSFEWRNNVFSGFRAIHSTTFDDITTGKSAGSFKLQSYKSSDNSTQDIFEVSSDNKLLFKVPVDFDVPPSDILGFPNNELLYLNGKGNWTDPLVVNTTETGIDVVLNVNNKQANNSYIYFRENTLDRAVIGSDFVGNKLDIIDYAEGIRIFTGGLVTTFESGKGKLTSFSPTLNFSLDSTSTTANTSFSINNSAVNNTSVKQLTLGFETANDRGYLTNSSPKFRLNINATPIIDVTDTTTVFNSTFTTLQFNVNNTKAVTITPSLFELSNAINQNYISSINSTHPAPNISFALYKNGGALANFGHNTLNENASYILSQGDYIRFNIKSVETMRIVNPVLPADSITRVGIGTTNPQAALHIVDGVGVAEKTILRISSATNAAKFEIQNTAVGGRLYELQSRSDGSSHYVDRSSGQLRWEVLPSGGVCVPNTFYGARPSVFLYLQAAAAVTPVNGTATLIPGSSAAFFFTSYESPSNFRIKYIGERNIFTSVNLVYTASCSNAPRNIRVSIFRNGVEQVSTQSNLTLGINGNQYQGVVRSVLFMGPNDYLEPFFFTSAGSGTITFSNVTFDAI